VAIVICWFASPHDSSIGYTVAEDEFKIGVFFVLMVTTIRTPEQFKKMMVLFFVAVFLYQFHSFAEFLNGRYEYRMKIVRMNGVDKTWGDPNSFAASLLHVLPYLLPFWITRQGGKTTLLIAGHLLLTLLCIYLTGSRRAYLGVLFIFVIVAWQSKHRWALLIGMVLLAPVAFTLMRGDLQSRLLTIVDSSAGPSNAHTSAKFRWQALIDSFEIIEKHPFFGTGPGTFAISSGRGLQAHNLYAQTMSEMGTLGVIALLGMVWCFWRNHRELGRIYASHPWWEKDFAFHASRATWLAVVILLFMGMGGHNLFRYNWLWFGAFQMIGLHIARERAKAEYAAVWLASRQQEELFAEEHGAFAPA
jgi:O-antigen ligase